MQIFKFQFSDVTVVLDTKYEPWFNANEVCGILGYADFKQAISDNVDPDEVEKFNFSTSGGEQVASYISESGLYALIFGSRLPSAKAFRKWVTSEVLPAIRKTGRYEDQERIAQLEAENKDMAGCIDHMHHKYAGKYPMSWTMETYKANQRAEVSDSKTSNYKNQLIPMAAMNDDLLTLLESKPSLKKDLDRILAAHKEVKRYMRGGFFAVDEDGVLIWTDWLLDTIKNRSSKKNTI